MIGILVDQIDQTKVVIRLIFALLMVIIVIFLGGTIHGAVSGLGLSAIDPLAPKGRYIYSAAIAKGITQGLLIPLFILVTALIAVYNNAAVGLVDYFLYLFGFYGIVFTLTFRWLLGILDTQTNGPRHSTFHQSIIGLRQPPSRGRQRGFLPFSLDGRIRSGSSPASWSRW